MQIFSLSAGGEFPLPNPPTQDQYQNRFDAPMQTGQFFFSKIIAGLHPYQCHTQKSSFCLNDKVKISPESENTVHG